MLIPMAAAGLTGAAAFDPVSAIAWKFAWWAEGTEFAAQGYSDTDDVATWPDEVATSDLTTESGATPLHYKASSAAFNNQPVVESTPGASDSDALDVSFTAISTTFSVVAIMALPIATTNAFVLRTSGGYIGRWSSPSVWRWRNGTSVNTATAFDTSPHLHVGVFPTKYELDGTTISTTSPGTSDLTSIAVGSAEDDDDTTFAFVGVADFDVTTAPNWASFEAWVDSHYGITIA